MLKKIITLNIISFIFALSGYAFSEDDITMLEYSKYGVNYADESLGERLKRLETDFFGMSQAGSIESRISNLAKLNSNTKNRAVPPLNSSYYNPPKRGLLRGIWDSITSNFDNDGFLTGFTPSMNTISSSGYLNNLYNNNWYNNMNEYCPYGRAAYDRYNRYNRHRRSHMHNPNFNGFMPNGIYTGAAPFNNTFNNGWNNGFNNGFNNYPYYNPAPYTARTQYYTPPNIETKSSIHILKD